MLQHQQVEQVSDTAFVIRNILDELVHAAHAISHAFHLICQLMPDRLALENAINDTISSCLISEQVCFNLVRVLTMPQLVDIFHDFLTLNGSPKLAARQDLLLHLEHL